MRPNTKCALIQRSCGYSWRQSLSIADIQRAIRMIKALSFSSSACCFLFFNCISSFVHILVPVMVYLLSCELLQMQKPDCMVMVDNCYGEFVEIYEPPMVVGDWQIGIFPLLKALITFS